MPSVPTIACSSAAVSCSLKSPARLKGESCASHKISSTHERPMPAMACWSRSTACSGRARVEQLGERRRRRPRLRAQRRERLVLLQLLATQELDPGGLLGAELAQAQLALSRSAGGRIVIARSASPHPKAHAQAGATFCLVARHDGHKAASARPTSDGSAAPEGGRVHRVSMTKCLPRRPTRSIRCPSSADSGGSNVRIAFTPGASTETISAPRSASSSLPRGYLDLRQLRHRPPS